MSDTKSTGVDTKASSPVATAAHASSSEIVINGKSFCLPTDMAPTLDKKREFCITASVMNKVLQLSRYDHWSTALTAIVGLVQWDDDAHTEAGKRKTGYCEAGKRMESVIGSKFEQIYNEEISPEHVVHTQPSFQRHPELLWIGASGDRSVVDATTGDVVSGVEIKYRAGARRTRWVDLQRYHGDTDYVHQCYTQMMVYDWPQNYLVVMSDVNLDYWLYKWDPEWWTGKRERPAPSPPMSNAQMARAFYDTFLRWYWEDDRSSGATAALRAFIAKRNFSDERIKLMWASRPSEADITHMRKWRTAHPTIHTYPCTPSADEVTTTTTSTLL